MRMTFIGSCLCVVLCCYGNAAQLIHEIPSIDGNNTMPGGEMSLFGPSIRIGAFKIEIFGRAKAGKPEVMSNLVQILTRYDIVVIQDIRDSTGTAIEDLLALLANAGQYFTEALSKRLGRTRTQAQYAVLYREDKQLTVVDTFQYDADRLINTFERPPFIVKFASPITELPEFAILAIHVKPTDAPAEINELVTVYDTIQSLWDNVPVIMMGDFNADCDYVTPTEWETISLRHDPRFHWLLPDYVDTTVGSSDCAYDRIVITDPVPIHVINNSASVYKYEDLGLTEEEADAVSNTYPVEFQLVGKVSDLIGNVLHSSASFSVNSTELFDVSAVIDGMPVADFAIMVYEQQMMPVLVTAKRLGVFDVTDALRNLLFSAPGMISPHVIEMVQIYLQTHAIEDFPNLPGVPNDVTSTYDIMITYDLMCFCGYTVTVNKQLV